MNLDELRTILAECLGIPVDVLSDDFANLEFCELGCDSLALLEASARIKQRHSLVIPDEVTTELRTPGAMLAAANATRQATGAEPAPTQKGAP